MRRRAVAVLRRSDRRLLFDLRLLRRPDVVQLCWIRHVRRRGQSLLGGVLVAGAEAAVQGGAVAVPLDPGVYFLRGAAGDTVGALEVNHDRRESRLAPAAPTAVRATLGPEAVVLGDRAMDRELFQGARRSDLTAILLAAAIAAALLEFALASTGGAARRG